jgi:hypothetical protein
MNGQLSSYAHIVEDFEVYWTKNHVNIYTSWYLLFRWLINYKKIYGIPRVTSVFTRACYCFLCTAKWIQPKASYPSYVDIHLNITLRICLYFRSLFKFSCQGSVTFLIRLACSTVHTICSSSKASRAALGPTHHPIRRVSWASSQGIKVPQRDADYLSNLELMIWMRGDIITLSPNTFLPCTGTYLPWHNI